MNWSQWTTLFSGSLATLLNGLLVPVIIFYSSEKIGTYKYCLLMYTLSGAAMTFSQVNTVAAWWAPANGYIFYSTVAFHPLWLQTCFIYGLVATYSFNLIVICWSFMIRYSILKGENLLSKGQIKKGVPLAVGSIALWLLLMAFMMLISRTEETTDLFKQEIMERFGVDLTEMGYIGAPIMIGGHPNWRVFSCLGFFSLFTTVVTIIVSSYWWKIRLRLKQLRNLHLSSFRIQYRLYVLLTFQTLLPLLFNTTPACLAFLVGLTQLDLGILIPVCGSILSFAQILDPIFTVILISDYRRGIVKLFRVKRLGVTDGATSSAVHSSSRY